MNELKKISIKTNSSQETRQVGKTFSKHLKLGTILGLEGKLGAGKTVFAQGAAQGLGIQKTIKSPTFVLMRKYALASHGWFYHIDCYRLEKPQELLDLGFKKIIKGNNIVLIEWAGKVKEVLPEKTIWVKFKVKGKNERRIAISNS